MINCVRDNSFDQASLHYGKAGITHFGVKKNLCLLVGGNVEIFPEGSSIFFSLIVYWIRFISIPIFQCQVINSFCVPDKFLFSSEPTHRPQNWEWCQNSLPTASTIFSMGKYCLIPMVIKHPKKYNLLRS